MSGTWGGDGKRPLGITLLIVALAWHLVSGFFSAGTIIVHLIEQGVRPPRASLLIVAALVIAPVSAGIAAVGLWRRARWALVSFVVWGILLVLEAAALAWLVASLGAVGGRQWWALGFVVVVLALGVGIAIFYVRYELKLASGRDAGQRHA